VRALRAAIPASPKNNDGPRRTDDRGSTSATAARLGGPTAEGAGKIVTRHRGKYVG